MIGALLLAIAHANDVSGAGPLTLLFPLVLVPIVAALWWLAMRGSRNR